MPQANANHLYSSEEQSTGQPIAAAWRPCLSWPSRLTRAQVPGTIVSCRGDLDTNSAEQAWPPLELNRRKVITPRDAESKDYCASEPRGSPCLVRTLPVIIVTCSAFVTDRARDVKHCPSRVEPPVEKLQLDWCPTRPHAPILTRPFFDARRVS